MTSTSIGWRAQRAFILIPTPSAQSAWEVSGPYFVRLGRSTTSGDPRRPSRPFAVAVHRLKFQRIDQRSDDGGKTWEPIWQYLRVRWEPATQWFDGTQHPWGSSVWHPRTVAGPDPDTV